MAGTTNNTDTISTTSSPFEPWMDFVQLRANSIEYLAQLTGDIWTDYNAHDPGITILEMLCYAVMDLGYRASLPVSQILAPAPGVTGPDTNFFTPAQILACNPLTILDYRRLLVDIEGVTNAWMDVATDQQDICRGGAGAAGAAGASGAAGGGAAASAGGAGTSGIGGAVSAGGGCETFLNGLYHVSLQLDEDITTAAQREDVVARVKTALMAHRNFCEDFVDINILCTMGMGVCADIELVVGADVGVVFQGIVTELQAFFSTTPKFYTLQELLQAPKCKPIESIFAGRPYDIMQSHGFVDPDEFEQIVLRKEIHLSDIYGVVLGVSGVKTIRRLTLNVCGNKPVAAGGGWVFHVPENYVPVFNLSCCGWQFSQNNRALQVDITKLSAPFSFNFTPNAKILYPAGSPYLDLAVEYGQYLPGLGDYYSIQNEFPRVYGIGQGGLPSDSSTLRQAQALQLKGYLLFFDQMLADYVAQLANIRSLFSLGAGAAADQHTYFTNQLASVPGIDSLISSDSTATLRAIAVGAGLLNAVHDGKIRDKEFAELSGPYPFDTVDERNVALYQFVDDAMSGNLSIGTLATTGGCFYFYLTGTSTGLILLGRAGYGSQQDALNAANPILSSAAGRTNYSSFNLADGEHFSFSVGVDIPGYYNNLQQLAEDTALYQERRGQFLDHLLARFAEQFVDLAILSYGFVSGSALDGALITAKEQFLANYVDLSSNRGKGPDYSVNGWYNNNVSGFEKRMAALGGMNTGGNHSLCNFVVEPREDRYIIRIVIDGVLLFVADEKLYSREATCLSARELLRAAVDLSSYRVSYDDNVARFGVKLYYQNKEAWCPPRFDTHAEAQEHLREVNGLFASVGCSAVVSQFVYRVVVRDHAGTEILLLKEVYGDKEAARSFMADAKVRMVKAADWEVLVPEFVPFKEIHVYSDGPVGFVNLEGFRFVADDTIVDKVGWLTYRLVDKTQRFKLLSVGEFDSEGAAREDYYRLIRLLGEASNIVAVYDRRMEGYQLSVRDGSVEVAVTSAFYPSQTAAAAMIEGMSHYVARHIYNIDLPERAYCWKYAFGLGFEGYGRFELRSDEEFMRPEEALEAGKQVDVLLDAGEMKGLEVSGAGGVDALLRLRKEARRLAAAEDVGTFSRFVENETLNKELKYIYRLVDKDHLHGIYLPNDYNGSSNADACGKKKGLFQQQPPYEVIDLCLGGDNIRERVDSVCGTSYYHFQLKCTRCSDPALRGLVLFESVQGYAAAADAQAAFDASYMSILRRAMDPLQYGADRYISTEEVFINTTGVCVMLKSVVFIPDRTKEIISWYNIGQLIGKLVALVKLYPIRLITDGKGDRDEFKRRFPCFELPAPTDGGCACGTAPVVYTYYFYVLCDTAGNEIWQSVWPVQVLQAARSGFEFFVLLLRYPGNYVVERDPCTCRWSIYIREVLAESTRRFATRREAWGPEGIEKFICIAQTPRAFHLYRHRKSCCDSFYVACPDPLLLHPCHYDTPESRDEALGKLYQSFKDFSTLNLVDLFFPHESNFIYDLQGQPVAIFDNMDVERDFAVYCCRLLELVDAILNGATFERTAEGCVLRNDRRIVIAHALDPDICPEEWKRRLQELAYYFPIVKEKGTTGRDKFCIEIRLPCFNRPDDDLADDRGCGCDGWKGRPGGGCWVAWKSHCCYETCQKAFTDYFMLMTVLADRRNYRPIDDCPCGDYRIVLHQPEDIVAFNPQCYTTPDMDCAAAARARALINAEGLHTVEHILLRPRTQEDCRCEALIQRCPSQTDCHFEWSAPVTDDPCEVDEVICMDPGTDPYSFIATVALPAWPQRFRSKENRAYIEYMLAREAPAHVLLRVLWLAPHDLCCFEGHYRQWLRWLACKRPCEEKYTPCAFIQFLFHTRFECLGECHECPTCKGGVKPTECFAASGEQMNAVGEYTLLNQIDELFCWEPMACSAYEWVDCGCEECGCVEEAGVALVERVPAVEAEVRVAPPVEEAEPDERERKRFINARHADYKNRRDVLEAAVGDNEVLEKAKKFIAATAPTVQRFAALVDQAIGAGEAWGPEVAEIVALHFLDKIALKGLEIDSSELKAVFGRMKKAGMDVSALFDSWGAGLQPYYVSKKKMAGLRSIIQAKK